MATVRADPPLVYPALTDHAVSRPAMVREHAAAGSRPPRLLDRVRDAVRARHYSRRT